MFKLVIQDDEGKTTVVPLIRDEITIGRKEGNTIRLTERNVSRRHARILRNNGEVQIEDLGSYNGIRVNNARIAERVSLRISDQVQIGDYKLYLKAEGVEQVDDARTMPIERIESVAATEVMPAIAAPAPTAQIPVTPAPAAAPRAPLAVADTDPAGRPVATAAQVAALTQTTQFGKLVVVSSNFAGKEYELTRPQMVIGRTDDNDIIINHRSISRNNVRVSRDPQTGRYTITDVGSSNGVRVNGQEYKNVELRRGDMIDLGHVRLRFVEPGEDFVFSRDAVITDVPETGSNRGMLVAIVLGVVVLGGVGAYMFLRNSGSTEEARPGSGSSHVDNGSNTQIAGSNVEPTNPVGSGSNTVAVAEPRDASEAPPTTDQAAECMRLKADKKWQALTDCANKLDGAQAEELKTKARLEMANELASNHVNDALVNRDLASARKQLELIDDTSVYRASAQAKYDKLDKQMADDARNVARGYASKHSCKELARYQKQVESQSQRVSEAVHAVSCSEAVAVNPDKGNGRNPDKGNGAGSGSAQTAPPNACDPAVADAKATEGFKAYQAGSYGQAIGLFEAALKCPGHENVYPLVYSAACKTGQGGRVARYWKLVPPAKQTQVQQFCIGNKLDPITGAPKP